MRAFCICTAVVVFSLAAHGKERTEHFDKDPGWDGQNNRATRPEKRSVRQDFGYDEKTKSVGGLITPAAEPAYYAKQIEKKTFIDPLVASGKITVKKGANHLLLGFFNSDSINEWRTPNSIAIRILGRGEHFFAFVEYCTSRWRAGGDNPGGFSTAKDPENGRLSLRGFRTGAALDLSLRYDPKGNKGSGEVVVTLGGETAVCHLDPGHKEDGATFNRFGLLPIFKSVDGGGEVWINDVKINGEAEDFSRDPKWDALNNRREYTTAEVRPRFDFGYTATQHAGGIAKGELGGNVFRGDCRYKDKLAAYGDRLETLSLDKPLKASGRIAMRRGVSDSTVLLGFYHSEDSIAVSSSQSSGFPKCFLGIASEGPSREGFFVYPVFRTRGDGQGYANGDDRPRIFPDGKSHEWSLDFDPATNRITVKMNGKTSSIKLEANDRKTGARFNRFGLVTTWIDGNAQRIYFDDLTYTCEQ